ncbi:hypothetical protein IEQ11_15995 [Lysobacter capsici]|uniref:hypothetical protein n=1 Tax=Lysobacter capsici TaxID=435897 RepID=UPI00178405D6|nr:hypothetical protein [Lysobacter capsici]UOF13246.1 hypothetical protein IEQ11_15995 [Lysobacter capsici]
MSLPTVTDRRGNERKEIWLKESELVPILHTRLLHGDRLTCCCGDLLTTNYYRFDVRSRSTGNSTNIAYAGDGCSAKLIELSGQIGRPISKLRLFDPLAAAPRAESGRGTGEQGNGGRVIWSPVNRELIDAISLFCIAWRRTSLPDVLLTIRDEVESRPTVPHLRGAAALNTILRKFGGDQRTLSQRLNALRVDNPTLRHFPFVELRRILEARRNDDDTPPTVYL